jgi:hypothetical protein
MDQVYSVAEACAIAHVGRTGFYEAVNSGALTARKRGSRTYVLGSELTRWIKSLPQIEVKHPKQSHEAVSGTTPSKGSRVDHKDSDTGAGATGSN